jgi:hypothetical protein
VDFDQVYHPTVNYFLMFDMHSNIKTPRDYKPGAWVLYAQVTDQSKADIFIKPGIMFVFQQSTYSISGV